MTDIETPEAPLNSTKAEDKSAKNSSGDDITFPPPKQAVVVYTPITYTFTQTTNRETNESVSSDPQTTFVKGPWKGFVNIISSNATEHNASSTTTTTTSTGDNPSFKKRKVKVRMGAMVIKMVNRLIAENVIAHDRVHLTRSATHVLVRILAGERTIPILLMRCERIGVGVVVGHAFGTSLEWSMTPNVTLETQQNVTPFSLDMLAADAEGDVPTQAQGGDVEGHMISRSEKKPKDGGGDEEDEADEEVSISSEEGSDDEKGSSEKVLYNSGKKLSSEKKKQLSQLVANARREWLDTGSRLRVMQVLESVEAGAALTFDYIAYVALAAWVAAMGLISNSVAVVVASMLLSPLMGPCLGATLGATLRKGSLVKLGLLNECLSLILCVLMGLLVGAIAIPSQVPSVESWPSGEMINRGTPNGLVMGIFVAVPSGMGVALSVLGRNSGGLTGVAISLSLLPPAVNAGLCWMAAILYRNGTVPRAPGDDTDYALTGTLSLCLTLVNICCIFIGGCTMFKLKEVVPIQNKNTFWSRDVKVERQHRRKAMDPDTKAIKLGVKAALELQEALAKEGKLHDDDEVLEKNQADQYDDYMKLTEAKRRGLAANVLEDALFVGGGAFVGDNGQEMMRYWWC